GPDAKAEPGERRMLNQALFDRITLEDDDTATITPKQAIATILASDPSPHNEQTLPRDHAGQGSNVQLYVGLLRTYCNQDETTRQVDGLIAEARASAGQPLP